MIDANIACSAGSTTHPSSKRSREFLQAVLEICHRAVLTPEIGLEWNMHQSKFAYTWRASMTARKKIVWLNRETGIELKDAVRRAGLTPKQAMAAEKDLHLLSAALATDKIVVSGERQAPKLFRKIAERHGHIRDITWANPLHETDAAVGWLERGARPIGERQLRRSLDQPE